jgi:tetratricopeptide (TPR) repeat protein
MSSHDEHVVPVAPTDGYYNLGTFTRVISTESWQAQVWFNRGLIWSYSFNHDEACKCFEQAIAHDGMCAMAYWGLAYAAGPNYNKSWHLFDPSDLQQSMKRCHNAARKAQELVSTGQATVTSIEAALIHAIQARFPVEHPVEDFSVLDKEYASAMERVYDQYGDDVVTLYADALMHTSLRKLFYEQSGLPIEGSPVYQVQRVFDRCLQHEDAKPPSRNPASFHPLP